MNVITRGARNVTRTPLRSGAIILMLAISIGLILAMLVARTSVLTKINEVKASTATAITINPAGIRGGMGGGTPLTAAQVATISSTPHVSATTSTLTDQLTATDTNLTASLELGSFGRRLQRLDTSGTGDTTMTRPAPTPRTSVTGTSTPSTIVSSAQLTSGALIDGKSTANVALVGTSLATKNNLTTGSTFTAYGQTLTVSGIFKTGNTFEDSGIIVPLATLQTLTSQPDAVTSVTATADSSDNVSTTVTALKNKLGTAVDITSQQEEAKNSVAPLESIANLALAGVIGSAIAAAIIILLAMIMTVRERRREIGVIKAIGGTNRSVITQFVSEALTLTVIGGVIGLALGVVASGPITQSLVSNQTSTAQAATAAGQPSFGGGFRGGFQRASRQLQTNVTNVTSTLTPQTFSLGIGIIVLIAIIGSALPAWAIARVRPAEVLRTE